MMLNDAPETWVVCPDCCGEGSIEIWESVSKWSIDPPCAYSKICDTCNGAGGFICEAEGDR
jgi:DnaJ-class molecular chaperone